jgi:ADP-ribose pyrophosphatase
MKVPGVRPDSRFELHERSFAFEGKLVRVSRDRIRLPHGHETVYETIHLPSAVSVVPVLGDEGKKKEGEKKADDDAGGRGAEVVLVEQFRSAVEGSIHEIPAGILEEGEDPAACARRELEEETGYRAASLTHLATLFMVPGTSAHRMHFYLAEGLEAGVQSLDAGECLRVRRFPVQDLLASILRQDGREPRVVDTKTHLGILHVAWLRGWSLREGNPETEGRMSR